MVNNFITENSYFLFVFFFEVLEILEIVKKDQVTVKA